MIPLIPAKDRPDLGLKERLEDIGRMPDDSVILVITSAFDYFSVYVSIMKYLLNDLNYSGICVTINRSVMGLDIALKNNAIKTENLYYIDCISRTSSIEESTKSCEYIDSPSNLVGISIGIDDCLKKIKSKKIFLVFDSISTLLIYNKLDSVLQFSNHLINKLRKDKIKGIIMAIEEGNPELVNQIVQFCDKAIRI